MDYQEIIEKKNQMRIEAKRTRSLLQMNSQESEAFSDNFFKVIDNKPQCTIAVYYPTQREIDTLDIIDRALDHGHQVCLPVTQEGTRVMKFAKWCGHKDLVAGRYKIMHPEITADTQWLDPDIICVPLLAFDRNGHRLGYGGGYYDATLADLTGHDKTVVTIGLAYAQQACLFPLPHDEHDVRLDYVITQQNIHKFTK